MEPKSPTPAVKRSSEKTRYSMHCGATFHNSRKEKSRAAPAITHMRMPKSFLVWGEGSFIFLSPRRRGSATEVASGRASKPNHFFFLPRTQASRETPAHHRNSTGKRGILSPTSARTGMSGSIRFLRPTSKMSHGCRWRASCVSTRRDAGSRWLWRLVRLFLHVTHAASLRTTLRSGKRVSMALSPSRQRMIRINWSAP